MLRTVSAGLGVVAALWCLAIVLRRRRRFPIATRGLEAVIAACVEMDWEELVDKIGKGYGGGLWFLDGVPSTWGVAVLRSGEMGAFHHIDDAFFNRPAVPGQRLSRVQLVGHCDCVPLDPFGRFRMGPAFLGDLVHAEDGSVSVEAPRGSEGQRGAKNRSPGGPCWTTHLGLYPGGRP